MRDSNGDGDGGYDGDGSELWVVDDKQEEKKRQNDTEHTCFVNPLTLRQKIQLYATGLSTGLSYMYTAWSLVLFNFSLPANPYSMMHTKMLNNNILLGENQY